MRAPPSYQGRNLGKTGPKKNKIWEQKKRPLFTKHFIFIAKGQSHFTETPLVTPESTNESRKNHHESPDSKSLLNNGIHQRFTQLLNLQKCMKCPRFTCDAPRIIYKNHYRLKYLRIPIGGARIKEIHHRLEFITKDSLKFTRPR